MNKSFQYIIDRFKEPSTWAGIALFLGFFGLSGETIERITSNGVAVVTAVAALVAIFFPDFSFKAREDTILEDESDRFIDPR